MHLPAKANSLSAQTFMANKSLSDSDSETGTCGNRNRTFSVKLLPIQNQQLQGHKQYVGKSTAQKTSNTPKTRTSYLNIAAKLPDHRSKWKTSSYFMARGTCQIRMCKQWRFCRFSWNHSTQQKWHLASYMHHQMTYKKRQEWRNLNLPGRNESIKWRASWNLRFICSLNSSVFAVFQRIIKHKKTDT